MTPQELKLQLRGYGFKEVKNQEPFGYSAFFYKKKGDNVLQVTISITGELSIINPKESLSTLEKMLLHNGKTYQEPHWIRHLRDKMPKILTSNRKGEKENGLRSIK